MGFLPQLHNKDLKPAPQINAHLVPYPAPPGVVGKPYRPPWDVGRAVEQGYNASIWVYRGINVIAENQTRLPVIMRKGNPVSGNEIEHQYLDCFNFKSSTYEQANILRQRITHALYISQQGAFVEVVKSRAGDLLALYLLPIGYTWPIPNEQTFVSAYRVQYPGKAWYDVPAENVIWIRKPHPTDPYLGSTPLIPAGMDIEIDYFARQYNRNFLMNDARPGGLLIVNGGMDEVVAAQLRNRFNGPTGWGVSGAGRITVMEGEDVQYLDTSQTARDSQYVESRQQTKEAILAALGVPESMVGNASERTYANAESERIFFWRETMLSHLETIARAFDWLTPEADFFFGFDLTNVEELQVALRDARTEELAEVTGNVRLIDEYRVKRGLDPLGGGAAQLRAPSAMAPITGTDEIGNAQGGTPGQVQGMSLNASGQAGMPGMPAPKPEPQILGPDGKPMPPGLKLPPGASVTQGPPPAPDPVVDQMPATPKPKKKPPIRASAEPGTPNTFDPSIDSAAWSDPAYETKSDDIVICAQTKDGRPVTLADLGSASNYTEPELKLLARIVEAVVQNADPAQPLIELRERLQSALKHAGLLEAA